MDFEELVYKRRTIRRYKEKEVPIEILKKLVDYGRVAPAGANIQAVEYVIIKNEQTRKSLFPLVRWAGGLPKNMRTPEEGRRPMAYIIVLVNLEIKKGADHDIGAAVENILLGAANEGLGACWMGAIDRKKIRKLLEIPKKYKIEHVISIGYPDETSQIESFDGTFKYWKDDAGNMHVPKRSLEDIILRIDD
ncbi:MAG: nitroreductase [Candidatus Lokiarchaeota archaeon]|nr:nitroreductase [Candidatus Lokiarchaeota archaeon]